MRPGRLAVVVWGALTTLGCTGPNPGYRLRVGGDAAGDTGTGTGGTGAGGAGIGGSGTGGTGTGGTGGSGVDAWSPPADGGAGTGGSTPEPPADARVPADTVMPPPDMTLPPDVTAPPPDVMAPPPDAAIPWDLPPDMPTVNLDDRLRAHWNFNEGSGTRVADRIGGNTGTLQGGASFVASGIPNAGANNYAGRFQGTDDHMTITNQSLPTLQVAKSITLWINPDTLSHTGMRTIVAMATSNDSSGIQIGTDLGRPAIWRWGTNSGSAPVKYLGPWTDRWYHLVYIYDTQAHRLYVDGVFVGAAPNLPVTGTIGNAVLGCYDKDSLGWEMYEGLVDDVRVYDKVIGSAEISRLQQGE